ncbi:MAG: galactokinase family protein, partial [Sphaerochaetaceae bacterium]|nr:galactokinase family protein [Sphaerochaetaceae bacterium]
MASNILVEEDEKKVHVAFAPYRICPLGAHVDHQKGMVTGFAIDKGVTLRFVIRKDSRVCVRSWDFSGIEEFDLHSIFPKQGTWGDYARAAASSLENLEHGFDGVIEGSLPIGGLSSSAAVLLCYLMALCFANGIKLDENQMIEKSHIAENVYIGLNNGILDQSCITLCKKNQLLCLDTKTMEWRNIPMNPSMAPIRIMVVYSGLSRNLGKGYNMRVDEVKSAAYALKAYSGMEYGLLVDTFLRDVPFSVFQKFGDRLPDNFRKRAVHFFSENERVRDGIIAWEKGDIDRLGSLICESGDSSIDNWETGCPELKFICQEMKKIDGIHGGRFSGAGFK